MQTRLRTAGRKTGKNPMSRRDYGANATNAAAQSTQRMLKIIIMSATLPNLSFLLDQEAKIPSLITNREKYYSNSIFRERVSLDFCLLEKEYGREELLKKIEKIIFEKHKNQKVVVEFIKKASAFEFYKKLLESNEVCKEDIFLITGDDNKAERKRIIKEAKNKERKRN